MTVFWKLAWSRSTSSEPRKTQPHPSYSSPVQISVWNQDLIVVASAMRHCRMLHTSGYRRGRATCTGREYMLKGGRRLSTKMDTTLKINCAFSNTAVLFCEVFKCPTFKDHEIKSRVLLSECPFYYRVTAHLIVYSLVEIQWTSTCGKNLNIRRLLCSTDFCCICSQ